MVCGGATDCIASGVVCGVVTDSKDDKEGAEVLMLPPPASSIFDSVDLGII